MLVKVWEELEYWISVCHVIHVAHIKCVKNLENFSIHLYVSPEHYVDSLISVFTVFIWFWITLYICW
jgi:hypothetical protein